MHLFICKTIFVNYVPQIDKVKSGFLFYSQLKKFRKSIKFQRSWNSAD